MPNDNTPDYTIIHFNGANRTHDPEATNATAIHPLSEECEKFLLKYEKESNLTSIGGVFLLNGLALNVIDMLQKSGFIETTFFTDSMVDVL